MLVLNLLLLVLNLQDQALVGLLPLLGLQQSALQVGDVPLTLVGAAHLPASSQWYSQKFAHTAQNVMLT